MVHNQALVDMEQTATYQILAILHHTEGQEIQVIPNHSAFDLVIASSAVLGYGKSVILHILLQT